jgi:hypothetical protein
MRCSPALSPNPPHAVSSLRSLAENIAAGVCRISRHTREILNRLRLPVIQKEDVVPGKPGDGIAMVIQRYNETLGHI